MFSLKKTFEKGAKNEKTKIATFIFNLL